MALCVGAAFWCLWRWGNCCAIPTAVVIEFIARRHGIFWLKSLGAKSGFLFITTTGQLKYPSLVGRTYTQSAWRHFWRGRFKCGRDDANSGPFGISRRPVPRSGPDLFTKFCYPPIHRPGSKSFNVYFDYLLCTGRPGLAHVPKYIPFTGCRGGKNPFGLDAGRGK